MRAAFGFLFGALAPLQLGCSGLFGGADGPGPAPIVPQTDPTPLAKCKVAADAANPLVTEWPASEKAHLQSLTDEQLVAVEYSGCELRIIDACRLSGSYTWSRTTLATDTIEIGSSDELYAKLPLGALSLEGELQRSGRLAVRTTVAGQLRSTAMPTDPPGGACSGATHFVSAISVGAFKLLSGSDISGGGRVGVAGVGAGAKGSKKEVTLREAGTQSSCAESTDEAPHGQCASPIQVFLQPLRRSAAAPATAGAPGPAVTDEQARLTGVHISFPAPEDEDETWTLRQPGGAVVCTLPCGSWVQPVSGYYLQREKPRAELRLPQAFPHRPGTRVKAEYQIGRGSPSLSKFAFYFGGIPVGIGGVGLTTAGIVIAAGDCGGVDPMTGQKDDCFPSPGFLIGTGVLWLALAGGSYGWFAYSREEKMETFEELPAAARSKPRVQIGIGPGFVDGTF